MKRKRSAGRLFFSKHDREDHRYMDGCFKSVMFFFFRAAQKLSLSRRKKSRLTPPPPHGAAPGPLLHTGGFSGALQLSPPAVPPCLLRARSKAKDTPGKGKVRYFRGMSSKIKVFQCAL